MDSNTRRQSFLPAVAALAAVAALGLFSFVLPTVLIGETLLPAPLSPLLRTSIEHMTWIPIAALVGIGFAAGMVTRLPPVLIALASVIALPIAMFAEIVADPTSHNLFPFELAMYLVLTIPPLLAALISRWLRGKMTGACGQIAD